MSYESIADTLNRLEGKSLSAMKAEKADEAIANRNEDELFIEFDALSDLMYAVGQNGLLDGEGLDKFNAMVLDTIQGTHAGKRKRSDFFLRHQAIRCLKEMGIRLLEAADELEMAPPQAVYPTPDRPVHEYVVEMTKTVKQSAVFAHRTVHPQYLMTDLKRKAGVHTGIEWSQGSYHIDYVIHDSRVIEYEPWQKRPLEKSRGRFCR